MEYKMTNEEFWGVVERIDWKSICRDYENPIDISKKVAKKYFSDKDEEWVTSFQEILRKKEEELKNITREYWVGVWKISDDSYWNLRAHIVGCGRKAFEEAMKEPTTIYKDYIKPTDERFRYRENFGYWVNSLLKDNENDTTNKTKDEAAPLTKKAVVKNLICLLNENCKESGVIVLYYLVSAPDDDIVKYIEDKCNRESPGNMRHFANTLRDYYTSKFHLYDKDKKCIVVEHCIDDIKELNYDLVYDIMTTRKINNGQFERFLWKKDFLAHVKS